MSEAQLLRVVMLGLRGFPDVQGRVEVHAEHLCPCLRELGCDVEVIVRSPYMPRYRGDEWRGVRYLRVGAESVGARGDRAFVSPGGAGGRGSDRMSCTSRRSGRP